MCNSEIKLVGLTAALGPLQQFSGGCFVRWHGGYGANDLDVEGFVYWMEGCFLCSCSFLIRLRQPLITWPSFLQQWHTILGCSVFC